MDRYDNCMPIESARSKRATTLAFWTLLTIVVCWVFSLPVFPSQDVPVHLYYAQIFGQLLHHDHTALYQGYFGIRSLLSVYALYYYLLVGLTTFCSFALADKIVVVLIIVLFSCGFRMLARHLGAAGNLASLFIFPVILSWPLGMGFHSFCLSAALGMFALAAWFQAKKEAIPLKSGIAFLALIALMMVTHPVPLLLVLALAGCELLLRFAKQNASSFSTRLLAIRTSLLLLCLASCSFLFVLKFTDKNRVSHNVVAAAHSSIPHRAMQLALLRTFGLYSGSSPFIAAYRIALYCILLGAILFALRSWWNKQTSQESTVGLWLVVVLLLIVVLPLIPETMNGSAFFADRLVMFLWVAALAAASCALPPSLPLQRGLIAVAVAILLITLGEGELYIRPVSHQAAAMEQDELKILPGLQGLALPAQFSASAAHLTYNPYLWQQARFFRKEHALMLNPPWLDLPILPIAPGQELLLGEIEQTLLDAPPNELLAVQDHLPLIEKQRNEHKQQPILFILYAKAAPELTTDQVALQTIRHMPNWSCQETNLYLLCRPMAQNY